MPFCMAMKQFSPKALNAKDCHYKLRKRMFWIKPLTINTYFSINFREISDDEWERN